MSKLSFRARALDASKPLPVFRCEDLPDLHEYASINRAVPQMPTGMEKEEESVCFFYCCPTCVGLLEQCFHVEGRHYVACASLCKMAAISALSSTRRISMNTEYCEPVLPQLLLKGRSGAIFYS